MSHVSRVMALNSFGDPEVLELRTVPELFEAMLAAAAASELRKK